MGVYNASSWKQKYVGLSTQDGGEKGFSNVIQRLVPKTLKSLEG